MQNLHPERSIPQYFIRSWKEPLQLHLRSNSATVWFFAVQVHGTALASVLISICTRSSESQKQCTARLIIYGDDLPLTGISHRMNSLATEQAIYRATPVFVLRRYVIRCNRHENKSSIKKSLHGAINSTLGLNVHNNFFCDKGENKIGAEFCNLSN